MKTAIYVHMANEVRVNFQKFMEHIWVQIQDIRNIKHNTILLNTIGKFVNTDTLARAKSDIHTAT